MYKVCCSALGIRSETESEPLTLYIHSTLYTLLPLIFYRFFLDFSKPDLDDLCRKIVHQIHRSTLQIHSIFRSLFSSNTEHQWNGFNEMWNQNTVINYYQIVWISSQLHPCYSLTEGSVTQSSANPKKNVKTNISKVYEVEVYVWIRKLW